MSTFEIDRHADELERNGYTILKNVLPVSEIQATKLAIKETLSYEETVGRKYGLQSDNLLMAFNAQAKHPHFRSMPLRYPAPAEVARRVLGEDMFCHNVVIRTPLPSGAKDHQKYGGNLHADWVDFTVKPFIAQALSDGHSIRLGYRGVHARDRRAAYLARHASVTGSPA